MTNVTRRRSRNLFTVNSFVELGINAVLDRRTCMDTHASRWNTEVIDGNAQTKNLYKQNPFLNYFDSRCTFIPLTSLLLFIVCRWDGGTWSPVADWHLPQWEKWGDEQSVGCRQHGRCILHAGSRYGAVPYHIHRRASVLLATAILLHGCVLGQARHHLLHQQGELRLVLHYYSVANCLLSSISSLGFGVLNPLWSGLRIITLVCLALI